MKLKNLNQKNWPFLLLAFAIPFLGMLIVMLASGYAPFGEYSMLYSDNYHQYYPFFTSFRRALLSGESILYTWNIGLGVDHLGLISYYLASPLNLLSILVPESWLLSFYSLLVPIRLGLASLFFAIFLKNIFGKNDISISVFGSFYGLCAWALAYQWNVMWLDTFALLPLVALGTIRLLRDKKVLLYSFTLFFSVAANYYIGFFTCIFVFLLFFCYQICRWGGAKKFFKDLLRIALFSGLAIGMTAFIELPALAALQQTQSSVNKFPTEFRLNIATKHTIAGLLGAMIQVAGNATGGLTPSFKEGLPNLYCGVVTILFSFVYLTCKKVPLKEKLCAVGLLLFFNVSFIIRQLDYIWHGFHFTNMIPYRFSFLYSFVLLYMAYTAFINRKELKSWQIFTGALLTVGIICCHKNLNDTVLWIYNAGFLVIYLAIMVYSQHRKPVPRKAEQKAYYKAIDRRQKIGSWVLLGAMALEISANLVNFAIRFPGTNTVGYPRGTTDSAAVLDYMREREKDTPFYRAEVTHTQTLNDGALNNYNGITTFTSSANVRVTEFMRSLGYGAKNTYNRYSFEESSPVANLFLGLKYMIDREGNVEENHYFDNIYSSGKVTLLENNAYLPLGFLANSELSRLTFQNNGDPFRFQDKLFNAATGKNGQIWETYWGTNGLNITAIDMTLTENTPLVGRCSYDKSDKDGSINYMYTSDREGFMCIYIDQTKRNSFTVWKNSEQLYSESYSLPQMLSVCQVRPGDVIEVKFKCKKSENGTINVTAGTLNEAKFREGVDQLSASTWELTEMKTTYLEGTIQCNRDGVMYTSIPDNGNWHVIVDGKPAEITRIGDAMVGVMLSEGSHQVVMEYHNKAFTMGMIASIACLAACLALWFWVYRAKKTSKLPEQVQKVHNPESND